MALAGGLSAQLGVVSETTFGTFQTPTTFVEFNSDSIEHAIERIASSGLRPSRRVVREKQWTAGREALAGDIEMDVNTNGFGIFFKHALGGSESKQPNSPSFPTVFEQVFTVGALDGKSMSVQIGAGDVGGTIRAFSIAGAKIVKWELSCDENGFLKFKPTFDAVSEATATALASASYSATAVPLAYTGAVIKVGGAEVPCTKFALTGETGQKTDRYLMRATNPGQKKEQLESDLRKYSGSADVEFESLSLYEKYLKNETFEIIATFKGPEIAGGFFSQLEVKLEKCRFDGNRPNVSGPGVIMNSIPFEALEPNSGANTAVKMVYTTTDSTIG